MRKFIIIFVYLMVRIFFNLYSQELNLIPYPKSVELKNDSFLISPGLSIKQNDLGSFYSDLIIDNIKQELGFTIKTSKNANTDYIEFVKQPSPEKLALLLKKQNLQFRSNFGNEEYLINISAKMIKIFAATDAGIFYGIQTLNQLIAANREINKIPCLTIHDYPDIAIRGWQDDISRGPIPTLSYLKKEIKIMSSFKLNAFTLYTEHVFKLKKYPDIAPPDGISAEEIKELSDYAKNYNVELIGNFQSFGHMDKILKKEPYKHLAESEYVISPAIEETYSFLGDVYSEIAPSYNSRYFNINCDETWGLGEGKAKAMMDSIGIEGIYSYHINRINRLLKPYNKQILMWGDIAVNHPKIVSKLPKDITVLSWGYDDADSFDVAITPFTKMGLDFWVAPGVSCWNNLFPDIQISDVNIYNYIRDGVKYGTKGVLNTTWDDDGFDFFENNWYGLAWGAENSWLSPKIESSAASAKTRKMKIKEFDKAFDRVFWGLNKFSLTSVIESFSELHNYHNRNFEANDKFFEEITPFYTEYIDKNYIYSNELVIKKLDSLENNFHLVNIELDKNKISVEYLKFAFDQVQFIAKKNIFRTELFEQQNGKVRLASLESYLELLQKELIISAAHLKTRYEILWKLENRNWWLDTNMKKFDKMIDYLKSINGNTIISASDKLEKEGRQVRMSSALGNLPVFYTLDGSDPDINSPKYVSPVYISNDVVIKARVIDKGKKYPVAADSLIIHKAIGKLYKLNCKYSNYHPSYDGGGILHSLTAGKEILIT